MENPWAEYADELVSVRCYNFHYIGWVGRISEDPIGEGYAELLDLVQVEDTGANGPTKTYPEGTRRKIPFRAVESGVQRVKDWHPEYAAKLEKNRSKKTKDAG